MPECEHGHPQPARCALCRGRELRLAYPERYSPKLYGIRDTRGTTRPVWFDVIVQDCRGLTADECDQYVRAFMGVVTS